MTEWLHGKTARLAPKSKGTNGIAFIAYKDIAQLGVAWRDAICSLGNDASGVHKVCMELVYINVC